MKNLFRIMATCFISSALIASGMQETIEAPKTKSIYHSLQGSIGEWAEWAKELRDVAKLARRMNPDDSGLIDCLSNLKTIETLCNATVDRCQAKNQMPLMVVSLKLFYEIQTKRENLAKLEQELELANPATIIKLANAYIDLADVSPVPEFHLLKDLYYKKAVLYHYAARHKLAENLDQTLGDDIATSDELLLSHQKILELLDTLHRLSFSADVTPLKRHAYALLLAKICRLQTLRPDIVVNGTKTKEKKKNRQQAKKPIKQEQQRHQLQELCTLLLMQADALKQDGRLVEAEVRDLGAIQLAGKRLNIGFHPSKSMIVGQKPQMSMTILMEGVNFGRVILVRADQLQEKATELDAIKVPMYSYLFELCGQLRKGESMNLSDAAKFSYYALLVRAIDERWVGVPIGNEAAISSLQASMAFQAAQVAPDRKTEAEYYQKAFEQLPQIPEEQDIFQYYCQKLQQDKEHGFLSNQQKKSIGSIEAAAIIKISRHLWILQYLGHDADVQAIVNKLAINKQQRQKKKTPHLNLVKKILAEKAALLKLQEKLAAQKAQCAARQKGPKLESVPVLRQPQPYWYSFVEEVGTPTSFQAEIRREIIAKEQRRAKKDAKKAAKKTADATFLNKPSDSDDVSDKPQAEETFMIPETIKKALKNHLETFQAIFTTQGQQGSYTNDVSVKRDSFLRMITAIGGGYHFDKGKGSHMLVELTLLDPEWGIERILDMEAFDQELTTELTRSLSTAHSKGIMTLSWPKKGRGHNHRFLLPEQIENARVTLTANGLVPGLVFQ